MMPQQPVIGAVAALLPLVYEELRKLVAIRLVAEPSGHTLQPAALVHEAALGSSRTRIRQPGRRSATAAGHPPHPHRPRRAKRADRSPIDGDFALNAAFGNKKQSDHKGSAKRQIAYTVGQ